MRLNQIIEDWLAKHSVPVTEYAHAIVTPEGSFTLTEQVEIVKQAIQSSMRVRPMSWAAILKHKGHRTKFIALFVALLLALDENELEF